MRDLPRLPRMDATMEKMLSTLMMLLAMVLMGGAALAVTYYVSPTGDDGNPGTGEKPWRTLQYAVDAVRSGDAVLVKSGTYDGCRIRHPGKPDAVCTLRADAGAKVLVNAAGPENRHRDNVEVEIEGGGAGYWIVDGLEVANSRRYGISLRHSDYVTARNCIVHHSKVTGIVTSHSDHLVIENNECFANGEHGIYHANSGDYPIIRGNRSHDNHGCGIHMNGDVNMGGDGLITHALVEKNVIWGNGRGGGGAINCDGVSDSIIRNNLCFDNHASGITLYAIDASEGSSRNLVVNNTVVMPADGRWAITISAHEGRPNPTANVVINNILLNANPRVGSLTIWGAGALKASDLNIVTERFSADGASTIIPPPQWQSTLADWQVGGHDLHSLIADARDLFINPAAHDYHLRPGSPAAGAGAPFPDLPDDLDGAPRPQIGAWDVGCYQRRR